MGMARTLANLACYSRQHTSQDLTLPIIRYRIGPASSVAQSGRMYECIYIRKLFIFLSLLSLFSIEVYYMYKNKP